MDGVIAPAVCDRFDPTPGSHPLGIRVFAGDAIAHAKAHPELPDWSIFD
jgi:hypothetical protein